MDLNLASGDNNSGEPSNNKTSNATEEKHLLADDNKIIDDENNNTLISNEISQAEKLNEDLNLKERIANCRNIIESLKLELTEEKAKLQQESKSSEFQLSAPLPVDRTRFNMPSSNKFVGDTITPLESNYLYSSAVESKLQYDDNLMEYEKQLQRYQETLNMAQTEKKNAIRKQMLAKVYKLKLLEVENQCNIELLRVKQSLECLEPLKVIVNKWKSSESNSTSDLNNYELMPRYPEFNSIVTNDLNIVTDDEKSEFIAPNDAQLES